jgi:hypothetical protein
MTRFENQRGQSMVLTLVFMVALMAMASAVLDVGSWYRTHRATQATADAAALAAAQELPEFPADAVTTAVDYGDRNGGGVQSDDVELSRSVVANDTVKVKAETTAPGFLSRLFGIDSLPVGAAAKARSGTLGTARYAAPIGVDVLHTDLQCKPLPCFGNPTTLELSKVGPGSFRIINIDGSRGGQSSATLGDWIRGGLDANMPLAWYWGDSGSSFNSGHVRSALDDRIGTEILLPIYREVQGGGSNFKYEVIGWVGWHLTAYQISGKGKLEGWFTRVIWEGIQTETATDDDFGARAVGLIE